ncbi:MAG TPA: PIN domain-containing protein [Spirochaetia bacterium]|nr:PIN domain-containing protein [Spirochaetia bacterium]
MILVDTNIIIDFWKQPSEKYKKVFMNEDIAICGIVIAELIHGAKTEKEIKKIIEALDCFTFLNISEKDWFEIGKLLNKLKNKGLNFPFQDGVLSYLAIKNNFAIWTNDKHFDLIQKNIQKLKIYKID